MANEDDDRKPSWSSWLTPGDSRRAEQHRLQKPDNSVERPSTVEHEPNTSRSQTQNTSESGFNPLIAFKHFVDDTFSAISEFSDNMAELRQAAQDRSVMHQKMNDAAYERWAGPSGSRAHYLDQQGVKKFCVTKLQYEESAATAQLLIRTSEAANLHVDPQKIVALYKDPEFNPCHVIEKASPWPFYSRDPNIAKGGHDAERLVPSPTHWLSINWFKHNPYSPVNLEADPTLAKYDTKWRHAFEDLLEAALDKSMTSREKFGHRISLSGVFSTWRAPGLDWMLSLQCRGILPPQLPHMYKDDHVNANFFRNGGFWSMAEGRWSGEYGPFEWEHDATPYHMLTAEYDQLLEEIATPAPQDGTDPNGDLTAEEHKMHMRLLDQLEEKRKRNHRLQWGFSDEETPTGRCPDEMGRAVGDAMRQSLEPDTELDVYEQLENSYSEIPQRHLTRCPDDLGRAVGNAARQDAPRPFTADKGASGERFENFDFEKFLATDEEPVSSGTDNDDKPLQDYKLQIALMRQQQYNQEQFEKAHMQEWLRTAQQELENISPYDSRALDEHYERMGVSQPDPTAGSAEDIEKQFDEMFNQQAGLETAVGKLDDKAEVLMFFIKELDEQLRELRKGQKELKEAQAEAKTHHDRKQDACQIAIAPASVQSDSNRPQVLSTLTTTQTTRLPDGSVKTTVVLKRRFADGAEETQGSTQTSFDESAASTAGGQDPSKKGWFWS